MIPLDPRIPQKDSPNFLIRLYELFRDYAKEINAILKTVVSKGNIIVSSGTAATPSIRFDGDEDTGIFSSGADQVFVSTNGSECVRIDTTGIAVKGPSRWWYFDGKTGSDVLVIGARVSGDTADADYVTIDSGGNIITNVKTTAPSLSANQQMVFALTSNTNLRVLVRGTDGVTRSANLTLS